MDKYKNIDIINIFRIDFNKLLKNDFNEVLYVINIFLNTMMFGYKSGEVFWASNSFYSIIDIELFIIVFYAFNYLFNYLMYKIFLPKLFG